jgi:predicted house-cleaning noncanonical NTP pyrophosphatase (MazG superfamily)
MKRIYYNKLIRDKVPANMARKGVRFKVKTISGRTFKIELLKKVGEEASSLPQLTKRADITDELADTLDVINEIKRVFHITDAQIRAAQKKAFAKKGGFNKRVYLYWSEDTGYRTNERTYKRH